MLLTVVMACMASSVLPACAAAVATPRAHATAPAAPAPAPEPSPAVEPASPAEPAEHSPSAPSFVELSLPRGEPAVVSVPGTDEPRPVLVATHGAGGLAERHCELWRHIVGDQAFVLCPRGYRMSSIAGPDHGGYFYDGHPKLADEISLALEALAQRFGARVDLVAPVYAGYSQGAGMGSMMLPTHPARFSGAVLMEGGFGEYQEWNVATARTFHERGARRVLLVCGRDKCNDLAKATATYMRRGGLEVRLIYVRGAGHTYGGALREEVERAFPWLVEGDPRW
jgi:predicted esterase